MTLFNYIPTILTIMLIPIFAKKFGKIKALFVGFLFYGAGLILEIAGPVNLPMIYGGLVLQGIGHAALYSCLFAIVGDVVDYSEWKDGIREEGLTYSVTSFGQNLITVKSEQGLGQQHLDVSLRQEIIMERQLFSRTVRFLQLRVCSYICHWLSQSLF